MKILRINADAYEISEGKKTEHLMSYTVAPLEVKSIEDISYIIDMLRKVLGVKND